jgi:cellulose synthase/poly-beta-1,6-N-acetylglucosamine synthase-like glycosyltransferase
VSLSLQIVFWFCLTAVLWTFVGYPAVMVLRSAGRTPRRPARDPRSVLPRVSIVLAVRNAASTLAGRLENLLLQDYPEDRLEVLVVCNGCTDGADSIARQLAAGDPRIRVLETPAADGKAGALNAGAEAATGEILVFADARQRFDVRAVRRLVRPFAAADVGVVTGRLVIGMPQERDVAGVRSYWELETRLRAAESATGSIVGATGAIYAVRRSLYVALPAGVILDDMYLPLAIVRAGHRAVMAPRAVAYDRPSPSYGVEYRRRVRTLVGNYELLRLMPELLVPGRNPVFGRYVSHKLLRVLTPALCVGLLISGALLDGAAYQGMAAGLAMSYVLGAVGLVTPLRYLALPSAFLLLHTAGIAALLRPGRTASDVWTG